MGIVAAILRSYLFVLFYGSQRTDTHAFCQEGQHFQDFIHRGAPTIEYRSIGYPKFLLAGQALILLSTIIRVAVLLCVPYCFLLYFRNSQGGDYRYSNKVYN
jgi:hypothetical protein